ncbi:MAG: hypothetical protein U0172_00235 [Nitrospiraceae bacterium]
MADYKTQSSVVQYGIAVGRAAVLCAVAIVGWQSSAVAAVEAETTQEKAARLHQQAQPDLFRQWRFDKDAVDAAPAGFTSVTSSLESGGATNAAPAPTAAAAPQWTVRPEPSALSLPNIIVTQTRCEADCVHLLLVEGLRYEYPDVSIRIRTTEPGGHRRGGLVFGWQDPRNYYLATVDLEAALVELHKIQDGKDTLLASSPVTLKSSSPWHALRALRNTIISKDFIEVSFDGRQAVSVQDQTFGAGAIGLAARGTGLLQFDNFHAAPLFSQRPLSNPAAY